MKVYVKSADLISGVSGNKPYEFVSATVLFEDKKHGSYVKINKSACKDLKKIKPGAYADMYLSLDDQVVISFEIVKEAPAESGDNVAGVRVDTSTGEVVEEIPAPGNENKAGGQTPGKK
ncbi:MAG: hypothetical protein IJW10_03890 [Clostridia bacterium]|nr:hypothetical protein [Clostridia bacterium]